MSEYLSELIPINYKGILTSVNYQLCYITLDGNINVLLLYKFKKGGTIQLPSINEEVTITNVVVMNKNNFVLTENSEILANKNDITDHNYSKLNDGNSENCMSFNDGENHRDDGSSDKNIDGDKNTDNNNYFDGPSTSGDHSDGHTNSNNPHDTSTNSNGNEEKMETDEDEDEEKKRCMINIQLFRQYNFDPTDVLYLMHLHDKVVKLGAFPESFLNSLNQGYYLEQLLIVVLGTYKRRKWDNKLKLKSPLYLKPSYGKLIKCNPEYIFGIQKNENHYLFGYITYDSKMNYLSLTDGNYSIPCILNVNKNCYNKFILIKKYRFITECFKECILEYLFVILDDIIIIDKKIENGIIDGDMNEIRCKVLHKGPVCNNIYSDKPECWLHVILETEGEEECLISSSKFVEIYPLIKNKFRIIIKIPKHMNRLPTVNNIELRRLFPNIKCYVLPPNIEVDILVYERCNTPMLSEVINKKTDKPVTFAAIIREKFLTEPLSSRTKVTDEKKLYGTPGSKTHTLKLQDMKNRNIEVVLYLNNWENIMCPLGLIPDMIVIVQYVLHHKNYFKSCALTNFQIIYFKPQIDYSTTKYFRNNVDWGPMSTFSTGHKLPENIICWCLVVYVEVQFLKIRTLCKNCGKYVQQFQKTCCEKTDFDLRILLNFLARDYGGESEIFTTDLDVLKKILNLGESKWKHVVKALERIKDYEIIVKDVTEFEFNDPLKMFISTLTFSLNLLNTVFTVIELKCRNRSTDDEIPKWLCLEARRKRN